MGEVADIVGGGTPSTENPEYWDGDIDWYAPAEIADQIYVHTSQRKITEQGYDNSSAKLLPPGTVLFTSRAGIGKTAILACKGCTNQGFQSLVPHKDKLDSYFIFSRTEELKRYGELVGAGSTFVEVSGKQMAAMDIMMPSTLQEQQTIGRLFSALDNLITLHQRESYKYSLCHHDLSDVLECLLTIYWELRKFSDLAETRRGLTYNPSSISDSGIRVLRSSNIAEDQFIYGEDDVFVEPDAVNIPKVTQGDILITSANGSTRLIGKHAIIRDIPNNSAVHGGFMLLAVARNPEFVNALMSAPWYTKFISLYVAGGNGAIGNLNKSDLDDQDVYVPENTEQMVIGQYFSQLDHLITLHQRKSPH